MFSFPDYKSFAKAFRLDHCFSDRPVPHSLLDAPTKDRQLRCVRNLGSVGEWHWHYTYQELVARGGIYSCLAVAGMDGESHGYLRVGSPDYDGTMPITQALPWGMSANPRFYLEIRYDRPWNRPEGEHTFDQVRVHELQFSKTDITKDIATAAIEMFYSYFDAAAAAEHCALRHYPPPPMPDAAELAWIFVERAELATRNVVNFMRPSPERPGPFARRIYNASTVHSAFW